VIAVTDISINCSKIKIFFDWYTNINKPNDLGS
jgi:hypothetical protein